MMFEAEFQLSNEAPPEDRIFYVYCHRRCDDNSIFYVGKGKGDRASSRYSRNRYWHHIANKCGYTIDYVDQNLTEEEAFELESLMIQEIGRHDLGNGRLVNTTDGGEGTSNPTAEVRQKISAHMSKRMIGNSYTLGRKLSQEEKDQRAEAIRGMTRSIETKEKMSAAQRGEKNHQFNPQKYLWVHKDGREEICTVNELTSKYNLKRGHAGELVSGERLQTGGWYYQAIRDRKPNANLNPTIYTFKHDEGNTYTGTQNSFRKEFNLDHGKVSEICSGKRKKTKGWQCIQVTSEACGNTTNVELSSKHPAANL